MIRVTLHPYSRPVVRTFDQSMIIIGNGTMSDVVLADQLLEKEHLKIVKEGKYFVLINLAHDPSATLNNAPFDKETLSPHDVIKIGETTLRFEGENTEESTDPLSAPDDYYLTEFDDEAENWNIEKKGSHLEHHVHEQGNLETFFSITAALLALAFIMMGIVYFQAHKRSYSEEIRAARGIADVTMALTYAQVHHIKADKHNWSDTEFLKKNIRHVIAPEFAPLAQLDFQGNFSNCPYMLRIYTNDNKSRFLVIAQPEPSILQWLVPKATIVVDSASMEMRKIKDVKTLNRLLVITNSLNETNALEISKLVKKGELVPLVSLAGKKKNKGFIPPQELATLIPQSDNLIYNAPRYYTFGDAFLSSAVNLLQYPGNSTEVATLQQEMKPLTALPDFVFYSSRGLDSAIQAKQALATFVPYKKFPVAYFDLSPEGIITNAHLLTEEFPIAETVEKDPDINLLLASIPKNINLGEQEDTKEKGIDTQHPLFLHFSALVTTRRQALAPIEENMSSLLKKQTEGISVNFQKEFVKLQKKYQQVDEELQMKMQADFFRLYQEYSTTPLVEFMAYVRATELEEWVDSILATYRERLGKQKLSSKDVNILFAHIQQSHTLEQLRSAVQEGNASLSLLQLPEPDLLASYQQQMHHLVLDQLNRLLLSPESKLNPTIFTEENVEILTQILNTAWVTDPDEYEFYLNEFYLLSQHYPKYKH